MSPWGDTLGRGGRRIGVGVSLAPSDIPAPIDVVHNDWRFGLMAQDAREDLPEGAAAQLQDVESNYADALMRAPGIVEVEDVSPRVLDWIFEHASIDFATALVAIDPPYLGVKGSGDFVFTDESIAATGIVGWNVVNIAGTLLFSNGASATYLRDFDGTITDISSEVIAQTFANQFGRTFAGAFTDPIDGLFSLGIRWNAASAEPNDWSGLGSGAQLLINNQPEADALIALRPIGFDALGILCRKSLWLGYPTGNALEPAEFRVRFPGVGCVAERTACVCPDGVVFLSDDGVRIFGINETRVISTQISNLLLPIDYVNLDQYYAVYDPRQAKYQLYTPFGVWIYQFPNADHQGRWYFRNYLGDSVVLFTAQNANLFWNTVQGTWEEQTLTWAQMAVGEANAPPLIYNAQGSKLGVENYGTEAYFDDDQDCYWISRQESAHASDNITTQAIEIEYLSIADSTIELAMIDADGTVVGATIKTLPSSSNKRINRMIWFIITGIGTTLKLSIDSGTPEIFRVRHVFDLVAPSVKAL